MPNAAVVAHPGESRQNLNQLIGLVNQTFPDYELGSWEIFDDGVEADRVYLFTLSGCAVATWLSNRYGQSKPLLWALVVMTGLLVGLALDINPVSYVIGATLFNFMWLFIDVFQLGTLGNIDHSGRYAALVPAAQGLTQSVAPAVAGYLLVNDSGYGGVMLLCAFGTSIAWVCYRLVYRTMQAATPDIADAS